MKVQEHYVNDWLYDNLQLLGKRVELKWDGLLYIGGKEGDGKSTLAGQIAWVLDPTYNIDRCIFTPQQFIDAVENAQPKQAIVYDEAQDVFDSYSGRDPQSRIIKSLLTRIRRKQLYIIIVAPDFWRINKYLFIQRSLCFILVYSVGLRRGAFRFYGDKAKHRLYIKGKKEENIDVSDPDFFGNFTNWFPLDDEAYNDKKEAAEREIGKRKDDAMDAKKYARDVRDSQIRLLGWLNTNRWLKKGGFKAGTGFLGITPQYGFEKLRNLKDSEENEE